jgi:hypothetical protein
MRLSLWFFIYMTSQFKTFLKILFAILALIGARWTAHLCALRMMPYVDRCNMPCQWDHDKGFLHCQPLTATLEIQITPEPKGHGQAVWFRATTTNQSCRTILLQTGFYAPNNESYGQMDDLILTDEMGRRVPTDYSGGSAGVLGAEKEIHPYVNNNRNVSPLIRSTMDSRRGFSFVYLDPGQTVATGYSELAPYRVKFVDVDTKDYIGTAAIPEPVPMKNPEQFYAAPPAGFRRLTGYDLRRPGRYKARFIINEKRPVERFDDPHTPFQNKLRRIVYQFATGWEGDRGTSAKIDIASAPVEFEISK